MTDYLRFTIEGAVPIPLDPILQNNLPEIRTKLRQLKSFCRNINEGSAQEENTTRFKFHICHHEESRVQCEPEQDI